MDKSITIVFWVALIAKEVWSLENKKAAWPWLSKTNLILAVICLLKL